MKIDNLIAIAEKQEELLQFDHFSRTDAWELGSRMAGKAREERLPVAVSIRLLSGLIVFQHFPEGTSLDNERWLSKKFNVVREFEKSSLLNTLIFIKKKWTFESRALDPGLYAWGGGGFPIRVKGSGLAGVFIVSGLPNLRDHKLLAEGMAEYLKLDIPHIPVTEKI